MLAKPTVDAIAQSVALRKAGGPQAGILAPSRYDASGQNVPTAGSKLIDAIPIYGPWARSAENETQQKGLLASGAGLATDVLASKGLAKLGGVALRTAGRGVQASAATTPSLKNWATRQLVPGTPGELLRSALKPGVKYGAGVQGTLEEALPHVLAADPAMQGVSGFASAADAAKTAAFQPYNDLLAPYRPPQALIGGQLRPAIGPVNPGVIEGTPIAEAQNASIPALNRFESPTPKPSAAPPPVRFSQPQEPVNPMRPPTPTTPRALPGMPSPSEPTGIIANTAAKADLFRKQIPVATADAIREDVNDKLDAFYAKTGGNRKAALSAPETARIKAIGDTTREQLYPKLESDVGLEPGSAAAMQKKYGTLSEVSDIANKREPVFARHDPVSLSQQIVLGHGGPITRLTNFATQKMFRNVTDSNALVNSAIDRFQNPNMTPFVPRAGFLPQTGSVIGQGLYGAGRVASRLPNRFNPFLFSAAANPPKRR
jgi:hypothetical protein